MSSYLKIYYAPKYYDSNIDNTDTEIRVYTFDNEIMPDKYCITFEETVNKILAHKCIWGDNVLCEDEEHKKYMINRLKKIQKMINLRKLSDYAAI